MAAALERGLPVALHAGQTPPNRVDTSDYEKRGWLGPKLLICHYLPASERDAETMARTSAPLSFATHSEFRLGLAGDPRVTLLRMRKAGVLISLSFDATSIAPPNMFETMRFTRNMGIPWRGTSSQAEPLARRSVADAEKALDALIDNILKNGVTEEELKKAKNQFLTGKLRELQTNNGKASALGEAAVIYGDAERINTDLVKLQAVTTDQVKNVLNKHIAGKKRVVIEYLPEAMKPAAAASLEQTPK